MLVEICSWLFLLLGSFLLLTGSFGLIRLPDFWSRLHSASISDTGGVMFLILGMMLHVTTVWVFLKLLAIAVFIFISSPTASHAIANAAFVTLGYKKKKGRRK
jgi:multicomponent Na+:H+ antiporter subunit G